MNYRAEEYQLINIKQLFNGIVMVVRKICVFDNDIFYMFFSV